MRLQKRAGSALHSFARRPASGLVPCFPTLIPSRRASVERGRAPQSRAEMSRPGARRQSLRLLELPIALSGAVANAFLAGLARSGITSVPRFGSSPGGLGMFVYAPSRLRAGRPLVVVLHGCGQDAARFATDAGWVALAARFRLALLLPQQSY